MRYNIQLVCRDEENQHWDVWLGSLMDNFRAYTVRGEPGRLSAHRDDAAVERVFEQIDRGGARRKPNVPEIAPISIMRFGTIGEVVKFLVDDLKIG